MVVAKRLGVGAASSSAATSENLSADWTKSIKKQILSVGKKRRHDNIYGEDDDDDDYAAAADDIDGNSSSDEEEGRTTAVKERKKKKAMRANETPVSTDTLVVQDDATTGNDTKSKKKKKKKGKKERTQEQQVAQEASVESTKGEESDAPSSTTPADKEQITNTKQKRKRPKVRSRQKNIAKDNRAANVKPSHLVPGRDDYAGRSMTQTTREKLGLGKSKSSLKSKKSVKLDDAFEKGEWVDEDGLKQDGNKATSMLAAAASGPDGSNGAKSSANDLGESVEMRKESSTNEESSLKKIGDCIVDYEPSSSSNTKKKKKDKKKKKYKNV